MVGRSRPELQAEAVKSVQQWKFRPATFYGKPGPTVAIDRASIRVRRADIMQVEWLGASTDGRR
jgi:hypothetical protein